MLAEEPTKINNAALMKSGRTLISAVLKAITKGDAAALLPPTAKALFKGETARPKMKTPKM